MGFGKNLKRAALVLVPLALLVGIYKNNNRNMIRFEKASDNAVSCYLNPLFTLLSGERELHVARGEPFRINYVCKSFSGIREISLYEDDMVIDGTPLDKHFGYYGGYYCSQPAPGEHTYKVVAKDSKGRSRDATGRVVVGNRSYTGSAPKYTNILKSF